MGFFSKKAPVSDKNDTHEMVDAKIHVMQHDLEEVSKNGRVTIESSSEKPVKSVSKESVPKPKDPLPSDSPFSQSIYPPSNEPLPQEAPTSLPSEPPRQSESPQKEIAQEVASEPKNIPTIDRSSAPLNLPTFEAVSVPVPRESSLLGITKKETWEHPLPEERKTQGEPLKQLEKNQDTLRTGTWPV
jgi:hypothetical protein